MSERQIDARVEEDTAPSPEPTSAKSTWTMASAASTLFGLQADRLDPTLDDEEKGVIRKFTDRATSFARRPELSEDEKAELIERKDWLKPIVRTIRDTPTGWPSLATFLDSDEDFMMYRRFGFVQTRLLLQRQEELRVLERKLENFDRRMEEAKNDKILRSGFNRQTDEDVKKRNELMDDLQAKFCEYSQLMQASQGLAAMSKPAGKDYKSVQNWIWSRNPLDEASRSWIRMKEDLVTLRPGREHAWLDAFIEHLLKALDCRMIRYIFCSAETQQKNSGFEVYFTRRRINRLAAAIITLMLLVLLIVPVVVLYQLVDSMGSRRTDSLCIGTLLVFTLAFSAVLSLFTRARRHEILAASAAYCAVLVVFLGNVPDRKS